MDKDWDIFQEMVDTVDDKIEKTIIWFPTPLLAIDLIINNKIQNKNGTKK